jgi:hemolysin III
MFGPATVRSQTPGEELANVLSHGLGCMLAVAGFPILVDHAARRGTAFDIAVVSVYAATMILVYGVSAWYHALAEGRFKRWLNRLDHAAIYVFIAGSYTPFTLGVLRDGWGWPLSGVVWALAALGVTVKLLNRLKHPLQSTALYLAMGWVALAAAPPLLERMQPEGLAWLVAGGLSYTLGAVVFLNDHRLRYGHFVWHLFVLAGSACHFVAVAAYAFGA